MPHAPEPWPSNELESLLQAAARNPDMQAGFARALLTSKLYVIPSGDTDLPEGESLTTEETAVALRQIEMDGRRGIAAFTSEVAASAALDDEGQWLALEATDLFDAVRPESVFLNPFGPAGCLLSPEIVDRLMKVVGIADAEPRAVAKSVQLDPGTEVELAQLEPRPEDLMQALVEAISPDERATAAYMAQIAIAETQSGPHPLIGIVFDGPIKELQGLVTPAMSAWSERHNTPVDLVDLSHDSEPALFLKRKTMPFYER